MSKEIERLVTLEDFGKGSFLYTFAERAGIPAALELAKLGAGGRHYIQGYQAVLKNTLKNTHKLFQEKIEQKTL